MAARGDLFHTEITEITERLRTEIYFTQKSRKSRKWLRTSNYLQSKYKISVISVISV